MRYNNYPIDKNHKRRNDNNSSILSFDYSIVIKQKYETILRSYNKLELKKLEIK